MIAKSLPKKTSEETEFGDFQTPPALAADVCRLLRRLEIDPRSIVEPTCGEGNLLIESLHQFPRVEMAVGRDISPLYIAALQAKLSRRLYETDIRVSQGDFFQTDWPQFIDTLPDPLLIIGNPPWVTNSRIGGLSGANLPAKTNFQKHRGLSAKTGKSNFDISEWMLIQLLHLLNGRAGTLAVLCKTAVSRKLLAHAWQNQMSVSNAAIYRIDAAKHFHAMVDACLFVCDFKPNASCRDCSIYEMLESPEPERTIGFRDGGLVADIALFEKRKCLDGSERYKWRSGIKHDCSKVMELVRIGSQYRNGFGQMVELEPDYLYPMLKTSEVAKAEGKPTRFMLVPQKAMGEDTASLQTIAPLTWRYLQSHSTLLDNRGSSIYKNSPRFSVFGVGGYSFAPWKVAISGFYKRLEFRIVGPVDNAPTVLDDASYFLSCTSEEEAALIANLLNSTPAREFFESLVFWDAKRPITIELLRRLDIILVARESGEEARLIRFSGSEINMPAIRRKAKRIVTQEAFEI